MTTMERRPVNGLIWVALPRATVGLVVADGVVVDAPPYLRRVKGADARQVWRELARQTDQMVWLPDQGKHHPPKET